MGSNDFFFCFKNKTTLVKGHSSHCIQVIYIKVQLVWAAVTMQRAWLLANICSKIEDRKVERREKLERRGGLGRGLTFLQGFLRACLFVSLSSAPLLPFALLCPFSPAVCPKTGSKAVVCKLWHSPLRLEPHLHQKLFELSEISFCPFHLAPFLYLWTIRYTAGGGAVEDKLVCLALLH